MNPAPARREREPARAVATAMLVLAHTLRRAGAGLGHPCCTLVRTPSEAAGSVFGTFRPVHDGLWSRRSQVLVRFAGGIHVLSMDGSLRGDV